MIKDPFYKEDSAYEILNLEPFSSHKEVQGALAIFMRNPKNRAKLPSAMDASKKLKNPKTRMEIDLLYYCIGKIDTNIQEIDINSVLKEFISVPKLKNEDLYTDLKKENFEDEYITIEKRIIKISEIKKYDDIDSYKMDQSLLPY